MTLRAKKRDYSLKESTTWEGGSTRKSHSRHLLVKSASSRWSQRSNQNPGVEKLRRRREKRLNQNVGMDWGKFFRRTGVLKANPP